MTMFVTLVLGVMAMVNLAALATGRSPTIRAIVDQLRAAEDGRFQLMVALSLAILAQGFLVSLVFPLKDLNRTIGLAWSVLMLISVLESVYTCKKMVAVLEGADTSGKYPLHDSGVYLAYQIGYNLAIVGACALLAVSGLRGT